MLYPFSTNQKLYIKLICVQCKCSFEYYFRGFYMNSVGTKCHSLASTMLSIFSGKRVFRFFTFESFPSHFHNSMAKTYIMVVTAERRMFLFVLYLVPPTVCFASIFIQYFFLLLLYFSKWHKLFNFLQTAPIFHIPLFIDTKII